MAKRQCNLRQRQNSLEVPVYEKSQDENTNEELTEEDHVHRLKALTVVLFVLCVVLSVMLVVK